MNYRKQFKIDCPEIVGEKDSTFNDSNYIDWLENNLDNTLKQVKNFSLGDVIIPFMIWAVRKAKIDIIDVKDFIEIHGYREDDMLVPVISLTELVELYKQKNGL